MAADLDDDSPGADAPSEPGFSGDGSPGGRGFPGADPSVWPGRLVPDSSLSRSDGGRVLVGGSPLKVLRFAAPIDLDAVVSSAVIDRLVDTGMAHPDPSSGPFTPDDVTVVVPVFGHVQALSSTLAALARMPVRSARIVVVDDASPDADAVAATVALAGRRSTRLIRHARNRGPAAARNTGTEAVTTPLVAYVDAGCVPEPGWLEHLLAHFADPQVALVAPRVRAAATHWSDGDADFDRPADPNRPAESDRPADSDRHDETRSERRTAGEDRAATGRRSTIRPIRSTKGRDRRPRRAGGWRHE
ncbi:MAG TPA: glycosyltransferase, partial [Acidimicrobiales bacterium]|nr:glycosyltransferase [Acidimicrobiales bacterium]